MASSAWEEQQYGSELEHPETDRIAADQGEEGDHIVYTKDVQDLKGKLDKFLRSNDLYSKVRDIIKERNMKGEPNSMMHLRQALRETGVISQVLRELESTSSCTKKTGNRDTQDQGSAVVQTVSASHQLPIRGQEKTVPSQAAEEQDQHNVKECDAFDEEGDSVFDTVDLHESEHSFGSLKNLSESTEPILKLHFVTGAAFTDNLDDEYHKDENRKCFYVVHVLFRDQRFRSPTIPVGPEPKFNCVFNLRLPAFSSKHLSDREMLNKMLASSDLIHCSLVQISTRSQSDPSSPVEFESKLISSWTLEWRDALVTGKRALRVELPQIGDASALTELPVGLVDVRLNVVLENCITGSSTPLAEVVRASESPLITPQEVDKKIRSERKQRNRVGQELASYTRNWYSELKHFVPQNRRYLYKITRRTMLGENRPITSFVKPFKPGHLIPSLHHAARFVSLFPSQSVDDDDEEFCRSHFEMIATKRLTSFERACLLCSLFRGFCLWSLVVLGTRKPSSIDSISEDHAWVVVINRDQHGAVKSYSFWEPMTGENCQQGQYQSTDGFHFENACLLFNDMELYANVNPNPNVNHCDWNVEDSQHWKSMDPRYFVEFPSPPFSPLVPPSLKEYVLAAKVEKEIKSRIHIRRQKKSLSTSFSGDLDQMLSISLNAYENERLTQTVVGAEDFENAVNNFTPRGYTFKAFPIMFNHTSPGRMFAALKQSEFACSIIECAETDTTLGVRCQATIYPEDVLALWLIVGVIHKDSSQEEP